METVLTLITFYIVTFMWNVLRLVGLEFVAGHPLHYSLVLVLVNHLLEFISELYSFKLILKTTYWPSCPTTIITSRALTPVRPPPFRWKRDRSRREGEYNYSFGM